ncbi:MAG: hypothetical protein O3B22_13335 [Proteobacteria bacterium]|nr:hypothetical protein [Pseudomonadota bacterium]MDA1070368.1 hypothetical protein [Pseudomonadota bacterium]
MSQHDSSDYLPDVWRDPAGNPVSCVDKLKLLQENLEELREMAQEALEDAVVMGCDEGQTRKVLADLVAGLEKPFAR